MQETLQALLADYKPSPDTIKIVQQTPILLLVGVSGAGKGTIKNHLLETGKYHYIVSHTTRAPRENSGIMEQEGVEYHFTNLEHVRDMVEHGEFIEAKFVHGNVYGTSVAEIVRASTDNKIAVNDIDVQGVAEFKAMSPNVIAVFVLPPSYEEWQRRLHARYGSQGVNIEDMHNRMQSAIKELEEALSKPYYHFVVNEKIEEAVEAVDSIAHHHDEFTTIDTSFRVWAERLLEDLRKGLRQS